MNGLTPIEALKVTDKPCTKQHLYRVLRKVKKSLQPELMPDSIGTTNDNQEENSTISTLTIDSLNVKHSWWLNYIKNIKVIWPVSRVMTTKRK